MLDRWCESQDEKESEGKEKNRNEVTGSKLIKEHHKRSQLKPKGR